MSLGKKIFVTGIGTEVGKTVVSAILVKALNADYWKPIQSGDLHNSDTMKVKALAGNGHGKFHAEAYRLKNPMSPHISAKIDGIEIQKSQIEEVMQSVFSKENNLVIEGAGGLMVPINDSDTIADIIPTDAKVILVSKNYLGSINHTLLSLSYLQSKGIKDIAIIFVGMQVESTEEIVKTKTKLPILGRIPILNELSETTIQQQAEQIKANLSDFLSSA